MKEFAGLYKRVVAFNEMGGVKDYPVFTFEWWKTITLQSKLLVEEATEAKDGAYYQDAVEILDGVVDNLVIAFKFVDMLEKAGYDVIGAFEAICDNNDTKIFHSYYEACEEKEKLEAATDTEYHVDTAVHNGVPYYTIKDMNGKIRKKVDFVGVNLSDFVPKE